ncbi:MAG: flavin reductase family protein [Candidatus Hydrothermia bacterium]
MNIQALFKLNYGLYVVASTDSGKINGQIANTVFQVTSEPIKIAVAINKQNLTHEFIEKSGLFSISVLTEEATFKFIGQFGFKSGRNVNKFEGVNYRISHNGLPIILDYTCAYIECRVISTFDAGTHTIFLGEVLDADLLSDKKPMTYDYYHKEIKGKTPKTASTYIPEKEGKNGGTENKG